jgi:hypothetical protein
MSEIKGPAIDPDAFRVEGHCCGIRIPALKHLTGHGIDWKLPPAAKAEMIQQGVLSPDEPHDSPSTSDKVTDAQTDPSEPDSVK